MSVVDVLVKQGKKKGAKYNILKIDDENIDGVKGLIRNKLAEICYGPNRIDDEPGQYTYRIACKEISEQLGKIRGKDPERHRCGLIGELLMHVLAPECLGFSAKSISMILALQDRKIKPGFDLNFYNNEDEKIWYGEVKSSNSSARKEQLFKARQDMRKYFDNAKRGGVGGAHKVWEAAKAEVDVMLVSKERIKIKKLLSGDRESIDRGESSRRNAILMAVDFREFSVEIAGTQDIIKFIEDTEKLNCFNEYIIICAHKKAYNDIIEFLREEGEDE